MLLTLVPDLSVAPLKYAHIHRDHGGPLASISFREREVAGARFFEAFANLDETKTGFHAPGKHLYGASHGMGTGATKAEAIYAAISESLERWAWDSASRDDTWRKTLRYDLDDSTTGFAAFPGLGTQGARKRAFFEAAERWSLRSWWEGRLTHKPLSVADATGIQIVTPVPGTAVALLWRVDEGLAAYGFAASYSAKAAAEKARIELLRNRDVLEFYRAEKARGALPPLNLMERRLSYFAEPAGHAKFQERAARQGASSPLPELIVDAAVPGPWAQYAHVWRCLFFGGDFHDKEEDDYFLF